MARCDGIEFARSFHTKLIGGASIGRYLWLRLSENIFVMRVLRIQTRPIEIVYGLLAAIQPFARCHRIERFNNKILKIHKIDIRL